MMIYSPVNFEWNCNISSGDISFKSSYLYEIIPVLTQIAFLSRRRIPTIYTSQIDNFTPQHTAVEL